MALLTSQRPKTPSLYVKSLPRFEKNVGIESSVNHSGAVPVICPPVLVEETSSHQMGVRK
jgi:hypothetical protein